MPDHYKERIDTLKAKRHKAKVKVRVHQRAVIRWRKLVGLRNKQIKQVRKRREDAQHGPAAMCHFLIQHYGQHETPGRSNRAPWLDRWMLQVGQWMLGQPWCGLTVWIAAKAAGKHLDPRTMSTVYIMQAAKSGTGGYKAWHSRDATPQLAWLPIYGYPGGPVHVGTYVGKGIVAEGNTSPGSGGSQNDGGGLYPRTLSSRRGWIIGYAEIDWSKP